MHAMLGYPKKHREKLHTEIDIYACIILQITCYQFFINFVYNGTDHKLFGLGLISMNEVCKNLIFILDNIYFLLPMIV